MANSGGGYPIWLFAAVLSGLAIAVALLLSSHCFRRQRYKYLKPTNRFFQVKWV